MIEITDFQKIGVGLTGFGIGFLLLGVILVFDRGLLAIGNILFISGVAFVIGLERTFRFFFQRHKAQASGFFFIGMLLVLIGWPFVGMLVESVGMFKLFSGFLPVIIGFVRRIPMFGYLLLLPGVSTIVRRIEESRGVV